MVKISLTAVAATWLALGATAFAEPPPTHEPALGIGVAINLGGGLDDFAGSTMRDTTGVGFGWTARALFGTHSFLAGEVSYLGSAQGVDRLGLRGRSTLYGNGAQADLRLNLTTFYFLQPLVYGGVAWRHYSLTTNGSNLSDVSDSTDTFEVPVGVGLATYVHEIVFEVRGEYRFSWANHAIVPGSNGGTPLLDRWAVTSSAGIAF